MASRFNTVNLSLLPAPAAVQPFTFEAILDARMADLVARFAAAGVTYDVGSLETDPAKILQEVDAYRETLVNQRINDAVNATSLAYAVGPDLDVVAANFNTFRAAGELDPSLRSRAQLAYENLSIGGSYGGYAYQALQVAPVQLADVAVYGHEVPAVALGEVRVLCLGSNPSGVPASSLIQQIQQTLSSRLIRKVNDNINVVPATIAQYTVDATLILERGSDPATVVAAQTLMLAAYTASRQYIGATVSPFGVGAALASNASNFVADVILRSPVASIGADPLTAPVITGVRIVWQYAT